MSALSFKINADTAKLNNFIKSLKLLYQLLEKFPSNSDGFKVINRHIADMEAVSYTHLTLPTNSRV